MNLFNRIKPKFKINTVFITVLQDIWNGMGIVVLILGIVMTVIMLLNMFHRGMGL